MAALTVSEQRRLRTAFDQQATDKNMERVWRHAESLVRQVGVRTGRQGPTSAGDLVQLAILGTLEGRHRWDYEQLDLALHLMNTVANIVRNELRRARRFREVSLDDDRRDADQLDHEVTDVLARGRDHADETAIRSRLASWIVEMRALADADRGVLQLLDAYEQGAFERRDVMLSTSMSARTYHNAHQRLVRVARKLPIDAEGIARGE